MMRVLITDMDGTLVDSMGFLRELAIALVVADNHSERKIRELYNATFGKPISEQLTEWNRLYPEHRLDVSRLTRLYESVHRLAAPHFPVTDFLRTLAMFRHAPTPEWQFALVTSTNIDIVSHMHQLRAVQWYSVDGFDGVKHTKPEQIRRVVATLGCAMQDVVYVGDAPSDRALAEVLGMTYRYPTGTLMSELLGQSVFTGV